MQFKIKFTKLGNKFFFISNLTEWHFSCQREYNKAWLKETGPLTENEKKALKQFAKILKKYGFNKKGGITWVGAPFILFSGNKIWRKVKKVVNSTEYNFIKRIFKMFEKRFEIIWNKEFSKLERAKKILTEQLNSVNTQRILIDLANFYNKEKVLRKIVNIYLFAIPKETLRIGGGAVFREKGITLEVSHLKNIQEYLKVIFHEIAHIFFTENTKNKIRKIIKKFRLPQNKLFEQRGKTSSIEELILCSLLPDGYLGEKYFGSSILKFKKIKSEKLQSNWKSLERFITFNLYPLAQRYIEKRKSLDKEYIETTIKLIKKFFKKTKKTPFSRGLD